MSVALLDNIFHILSHLSDTVIKHACPRSAAPRDDRAVRGPRAPQPAFRPSPTVPGPTLSPGSARLARLRPSRGRAPKNFGGCDPNHRRGLRAGLALVPRGPILFGEGKITMTMKTRRNIRAIIAVVTLALIAGLNTQAFAAPTTWLFAPAAIIAVVTLALIAGLNTQPFAALSSSETPSKSKDTLIRVALHALSVCMTWLKPTRRWRNPHQGAPVGRLAGG